MDTIRLVQYQYSFHSKRIDTSYLNYYNLFKGFENLKNKLPNNEKELKHYCFNSGNSMTSIMLVIEEYKKIHHNLFTYLLIKEFNLLVKEINKIIKDEKFLIDKIKLPKICKNNIFRLVIPMSLMDNIS